MKIIGVEREEGQIKSIQVETADGVIKFVPMRDAKQSEGSER